MEKSSSKLKRNTQKVNDDVSGCTTNKIGTMKFIWNINNFHMASFRYRDPVLSPPFALNTLGSPKYRFELYPYGKSKDEKAEYVSLRLTKLKEEEVMQNVGYTCSLKYKTFQNSEEDSEDPHWKSTVLKFTARNNAYVYPRNLFPDGDLRLESVISYENGICTSEWISNSENLAELSCSLEKTYEEQLHCDLRLISGDGNYKVHRAILDARFPEFLGQLESSADNNILISSKIDERVIPTLLRYFYCGKLDRTNLPIGIYDVISNHELLSLKSVLFSDPKSINAITSFKEKKLIFTWKIQNFSLLKPNETLSRLLVVDESLKWTWLKVYFKIVKWFESDASRTNIVISIQRYLKLCKTVVCNVNVLGIHKTFQHSFGSEDLWIMPPFTPKDTRSKKPFFNLPNDELPIDIEISVLDGTFESYISRTDYLPCSDNELSQSSDDFKQLQKDMRKLLYDSKFYDVTLVGAETLRAHRFIMSARSRYFRKMFEHNKSLNEIIIKEFGISVVKSMLKFMYYADTGDDIIDINYAMELYGAANTYIIPGLKRICVTFLKSSVSSENAVQILLCADDYRDLDLTDYVVEFMCSKDMRIDQSEEWKRIVGRKNLERIILDKTLSYMATSVDPEHKRKPKKKWRTPFFLKKRS